MEIIITNLQKRPLHQKLLRGQGLKILAHEKVFRGKLSLVFVTDRTIKLLNQRFLSKNQPTDVLAFDFSKGQFKSRKAIFAEIIISTDTAQRNAKAFKTNFGYELTLYLAHGILHLLGFDDHDRKKIKAMRSKESQLLNFLKAK
ncbi:MAG: rRNA maturation RNase YbeY [Candidatus Omnitrophota bacterium]|nr:rRNA maturation RNase YbeY [Candidatus Omnitrophota bacterium]